MPAGKIPELDCDKHLRQNAGINRDGELSLKENPPAKEIPELTKTPREWSEPANPEAPGGKNTGPGAPPAPVAKSAQRLGADVEEREDFGGSSNETGG
jgi:hypothetical protein